MFADHAKMDKSPDVVSLGEGMVELGLLVPEWQAQSLVEAAQREGITVGQFLRRLLDRSLPPPRVAKRERLDFCRQRACT